MPASKSFKDLIVWQRAMELVEAVYRVSEKLPKHEIYGLSSQICRAAVSIPSNISEGAKRGTTKDFLQFLRIASGSAAELETQLLIIHRVHRGIECSAAQSLLAEVQKMLTALIRRMA